MKCYKCGGTGVYDIYNDCPVCDGTGEYDPTDKGFGLPHDWENTVWDTDVYLDDIDKANDIKVPPFTEAQKMVIEATEKLAKKCDKISANVNKWGRKNICDVDDDIDEIPANPCKDCISKNVCGNPNITGCISYTKQDEKFLPINCYVCNASGRIAGNSYRHPSKCTRCNGTGEINFYTMTNEDEIKMSQTSKLAEWIAKNIRDTIKLTNGNTEYTELITSAEWWYRWLKQPHTFE